MSHSQVRAQMEFALIPAEMLPSLSLMFPSKCFHARKGRRRAFHSKRLIFMVWGALLAVSASLPFSLAVLCVCASRNVSPSCSALWNDVSLVLSQPVAQCGFDSSCCLSSGVCKDGCTLFLGSRAVPVFVPANTARQMPGSGISAPANLCPWGQTHGPHPYLSLFCFCIAEFDKFLEERAKAAEMVPNLPSPPLEAPTPPTNPSSRKKQERSEDALFAL